MDLHDGSGFRTYAEDVASVLGHADRVIPFEDYCVGLLSAERRKSVEPLAAVTAPGVAEQTGGAEMTAAAPFGSAVPQMSSAFREDINGLRAVAVSAVTLFHFSGLGFFRRVMRIVLAMLAVIVIGLALGYFFLNPSEYLLGFDTGQRLQSPGPR